MSDNACRDLSRVVWICCRLSGDAIEELGLSDGLHRLWTILAIHRAIFHTNGRHYIVPAAGILNELFEEITVVGSLSQVVVRITNR
jgi:hypothetical protein